MRSCSETETVSANPRTLFVLFVAALSTLSGCPASDGPVPLVTPPDDPIPTPPEILTVLSANVGTLDEVFDGPCPSAPYRGALCSMEVEAVIRERIDRVKPDVAVLMEVLDADYCDEGTWEGDPDLPCTGAPDREPYQQIRRLVGDDYTITCDGIAHYDCIAVRSARIAIEQCPGGELCMAMSTTPAHPEECVDSGGITSVSRVDATLADGRGFRVIAAHPLNAITEDDDACRHAQYRLALDELPGDRDAIAAGDMNFDPYRFPDLFPSGEYWHTVVGEGNRFVAHSVFEDPPVPTWSGIVTLDYVLSDFLTGHDCEIWGETPGTDPIDGDLGRADHDAVYWELELPLTSGEDRGDDPQ